MSARVLIVDDNALSLKLTKVVLAGAGYEVHTAANGHEALAMLPVVRPRLLVLDIQMPGMDGLQLTRRLRDDPDWKDLVILATTAYAMAGDEERLLAAGCDGYISKPINTGKLADTVAAHLERRAHTPGSR